MGGDLVFEVIKLNENKLAVVVEFQPMDLLGLLVAFIMDAFVLFS